MCLKILFKTRCRSRCNVICSQEQHIKEQIIIIEDNEKKIKEQIKQLKRLLKFKKEVNMVLYPV